MYKLNFTWTRINSLVLWHTSVLSGRLNDVVLLLDKQRVTAQLSFEELFDSLVDLLEAAFAVAKAPRSVQQMNHPDQIPEGLLFAHPARYRRSRQKPKPAVLEQHRVVDRKLQQQPHVTGHVFQRLVPHRIVQHLGLKIEIF